MRNLMPFHFEVPVSFFEKASAPSGQQRRIGGIISTESPDRQGEIVLVKGLDLGDWLKNGWYNDNHSKDTDGIVGYPESAQIFRKGETLPNGQQAATNGLWAEGYLLDGHDRADKIWKLGKALQGTGRSLGYSVEGNIHRRIGPKTVFKKSQKGKGSWVGNTVAKASVRNVAITNCFPGYVRVSGTAEGVSRRMYSGPMVEIELLTGEKLTGTPNHPIFTQRGWVALGELNEVHDCVGCYRHDLGLRLPSSVTHDVDNVPSSLQEVFDLALLSQAPSRICPGEKRQFHGDGSSSDVNVVSVDGLLKRSMQAAFVQKFGQGALPTSDTAQVFLSGHGSFAQLLRGNESAAARLIGSQSPLALLLISEQLAAPQLFSSTGTGDTMAFGYVEDRFAGDSITGRDCGRTLSPAIGFSNLKSKRTFDFCGHVFNLETEHGWYQANGVVVHNCPVNVETGLEMLSKSLRVAESADLDDFESRIDNLEKALAMGTATGINPPAGPQTGEGAGQVITGQSLERKGDPRLNEKKKKDDDEETKKSLSDTEAIEWFLARVPSAALSQAARFVELTKALRGQGQL